MAKTIKVIDLFNKIANEEDVPKEINYKNSFYKWEQYHEKYWYYETGLAFYRGLYFNDNMLNDTVEIIQEQQEIDIQSIEDLPQWVTRRDGEVTQQEGKRLEMAEKINKLVQAVKQLDKNIKDKE